MTAVAEQPLTTADLERRLFNKYNKEDFALCFNVRNDAGFSASRTADALGIGLWPSRGNCLYGFELKASRGDWLNELKDPAKAEAFMRYCDYWFIVAASKEIVKPSELPVGWGLLVPKGEGLTVSMAAAKNETPLSIPRGMLAAFVKRAQSQNPNADILKQTYEKGKAEGIELGRRHTSPDGRLVEDAKRLRETVTKFAKETGINPEYFYDATLLKKAMALVRTGKTLGNSPANLRTVAHQLRNALGAIDEAVAAAETIGRELSKELNASQG